MSFLSLRQIKVDPKNTYNSNENDNGFKTSYCNTHYNFGNIKSTVKFDIKIVKSEGFTRKAHE